MKKLILIIAIAHGASFPQNREEPSRMPVIQRSTEGKLACSVTTSPSGHMEYFVSGPNMRSLKKLTVLRCFSKALRARHVVVVSEEEHVTAQVHSEILGGIRCYRTNLYIVKFRDDIPDNIEGLARYCYKKAWEESQEKRNLRRWA